MNTERVSSQKPQKPSREQGLLQLLQFRLALLLLCSQPQESPGPVKLEGHGRLHLWAKVTFPPHTVARELSGEETLSSGIPRLGGCL